MIDYPEINFGKPWVILAACRRILSMNASDIFHKTTRGKAEIAAKTDALSMKERRVLILVNGENTVATLARLSLCDDVDAILKRLLHGGFIAAQHAGAGDVTETEIDVTERDVTERDLTESTS